MAGTIRKEPYPQQQPWQTVNPQDYDRAYPDIPQGYANWNEYVKAVLAASDAGQPQPRPYNVYGGDAIGNSETEPLAWLLHSLGYARLAPYLDQSDPRIQQFLDSTYYSGSSYDAYSPWGDQFTQALIGLGLFTGGSAALGAFGGVGAAVPAVGATAPAVGGAVPAATGGGLALSGLGGQLLKAGVGLSGVIGGLVGGAGGSGGGAGEGGPGGPEDPMLLAGRQLAEGSVPLQTSAFLDAVNKLRARATGSTSEILPAVMGEMRGLREEYAGATQALSRKLGFAGGGQVTRGKQQLLGQAGQRYGSILGKQQQLGFGNLINTLGGFQPTLSGMARPPSVSTATSPFDTTNMGRGLAGLVSTAKTFQNYYNSRNPTYGGDTDLELLLS